MIKNLKVFVSYYHFAFIDLLFFNIIYDPTLRNTLYNFLIFFDSTKIKIINKFILIISTVNKTRFEKLLCLSSKFFSVLILIDFIFVLFFLEESLS